MKIAIESKIPFIKGVLENVGHEVTYLAPEEFTAQAVRDMDALIVRTRTRCNAALLRGSRVCKIATATIGTDHIDLDYCRSHSINVHNAPGCNAPAVAQYVLSSVAALNAQGGTLGIVGVGHVGSIVRRWAEANGIRTLLCDPPLGLPATLSDLADEADVITFHTPLDATTGHMGNRAFFESLRRKPIIINAARGPIIDTPALKDALRYGKVSQAVIDCWEGEPDIDLQLLNMAAIATPHIAGYSLEGKRRATAMAVHAIDPTIALPLDPVADSPTLEAICSSYDPMTDTASLKASPHNFEVLRNSYNYRNEP